jgi:hypothetical protein
MKRIKANADLGFHTSVKAKTERTHSKLRKSSDSDFWFRGFSTRRLRRS